MTNLGNARRLEDRFKRMRRDRFLRDYRLTIALVCFAVAGAVAWGWPG